MQFIIGKTKFKLSPAFYSWRTFCVKSVPSPYEVVVADAGPAAQISALMAENPGNLLLVDRKVWNLHLKNIKVDRSRIFFASATEDFKTTAGIFRVVDFLAKRNFTKREKLVVVGGGIIEDVGAFVGAIYKRGINWVYFPTTLLSMCDSCIGGKTGINYKKTKNQLALFSAPSKVIINPKYLLTLPSRHILSGLGEALKLHITGGETAFKNYADNIDAALKSDLASITRILKGSLSIKRAVVEYDEFEKDTRRAMNYGHTIGHAVETMSKYKISHGEAVSIGMLIVNELSRKIGMLSRPSADFLEKHTYKLLGNNANKEVSKLNLSELSDLLLKDKKTQGKNANFVLMERLGVTKIVPLKIGPELASTITGIIKEKFI